MARVNHLINRRRKTTGTILTSIAMLLTVIMPVTTKALDIKPYPGASVEIQINEKRNNYPLISSLMKKVNGVVLADKIQRLNGQLVRTVYQLPTGHESDDAYQFFTDQFKALSIEPMFACNSFGCGDSNFWANNIFDVSTLYGMNKEQYYYIGRKLKSEAIIYYVAYTVKRGNRRVYALVDEFAVPFVSSVGSVQQSNILKFDQTLNNKNQLVQSATYQKIIKSAKEKSTNQLIAVIEIPLIMDEGAVNESLSKVDKQLKVFDDLTSLLKQQLKDDNIDEQRFRILPSFVRTKDNQPNIRLFISTEE